jgi:alcohol dehydrogenase
MRAAFYSQFQGPITIESLPDPEPPAAGVVLAVRASGLCRSDWHGWMGHDADIRLPHVPGHELAGEIVAVGRDVRRWKLGQRVTVPFVSGCGACSECRAGQQQVCDHQFQPGFTHWGSFSEYVALDYADGNLVELPESIDDVTAASLGCRFVTSFRAIVDKAAVRPGEWVAVHGCGGVELAAIMIAAALGALPIAVDVSSTKLAFARHCGAVEAINATEVQDVPAAIHERTRGGAHVSIDALGSTVTCVNSILGLRKRGRHVQVGLMAGRDATPPLPMGRVIAGELELHGSHGMQAHRYPPMLEMIRLGVLQPARLIGRRIGLDQLPGALMDMDSFPTVGVTVVERF